MRKPRLTDFVFITIPLCILREICYPRTACRGEGNVYFRREMIVIENSVMDSARMPEVYIPIRPPLRAKLDHASGCVRVLYLVVVALNKERKGSSVRTTET